MQRTGRGRLAIVGLLVTAGVVSACARESAQAPSRTIVAPKPSSTVPRIPVPEAARDFAWADHPRTSFPEAYTLTLVRGIGPRQALRTVVGRARITSARAAIRDVERRNDATSTDDDSNTPYFQTVLAAQRDGWTFVLEDNNTLAASDGVSAELSRNGTAFVLFENIELDTDFQYARQGRLVRQFEPFSYDGRAGRALAAERGLPLGRPSGQKWMRALELTLVRRIAGLRVRPADLRTSRYTLGASVEL